MTTPGLTPGKSQEVGIPASGAALDATLDVPPNAIGLVVFAHGSGSSRFSPRNRAVAAALQKRGMATLLADLLTRAEGETDARTGHLRFDIGLLAERLLAASAWAASSAETSALPLGYFGASTGAAAALVAAAREPDRVHAVVSRGGRPDLAGSELDSVRAPTLLIVGGNDVPVIPLNKEAYDALRCERELLIVPGASHLFEEPGAMDTVSRLAGDWFVRFLGGAGDKKR
jgi:dienelactone hydrolase